MGLDITVYKNIEPTQDEDYCFKAFQIEGLKESRMKNLKAGQEYNGENVFSFRAGSYGGYNAFRNELAKLSGLDDRTIWANPEKYKDVPFYELINFSDCEGVMDWETAAVLCEDFIENFNKAMDNFDQYYMSKYKDWSTALELAKEKGVIVFH